MLKDFPIVGIDIIIKKLIFVHKAYREPNDFNISCFSKHLISECLLLSKKYNDFLAHSVPNRVYSIVTVDEINLRLTVERMLGMQADPLDIYRTHFPRKSKIIKSKPKQFEKKIEEIFTLYSESRGGWFDIFDDYSKNENTSKRFLGFIQTSSLWGKDRPSFDLIMTDYFSIFNGKLFFVINGLTTKAENLLQIDYGLPNVKIKWRSETILYRRIRDFFLETKVFMHGQPEWLGKQHFDIWIPEWNIAIEYQGSQHFEPVIGLENLKKIQARDQRKMRLAAENKVQLILVEGAMSIEDTIAQIENARKV